MIGLKADSISFEFILWFKSKSLCENLPIINIEQNKLLRISCILRQFKYICYMQMRFTLPNGFWFIREQWVKYTKVFLPISPAFGSLYILSFNPLVIIYCSPLFIWIFQSYIYCRNWFLVDIKCFEMLNRWIDVLHVCSRAFQLKRFNFIILYNCLLVWFVLVWFGFSF